MSGDERHWLEEAISCLQKATAAGLTMVLVRRQDSEGEADLAITNTTDPALVCALFPEAEEDE